MKRAILSAILGVASLAMSVSSYAQGHIAFDNYNSSPYMPVKYNGGDATSANIHLDLLYFIGATANAGSLTSLNQSIALNPTKADSFGNHGYIDGVALDIPGYTSGPVTFMIRAWDVTTGADYASATAKGQSALWQEASLATGQSPANFFAGLSGPNGSALLNVNAVPEPSTFALGGIASAALLIFRRRK